MCRRQLPVIATARSRVLRVPRPFSWEAPGDTGGGRDASPGTEPEGRSSPGKAVIAGIFLLEEGGRSLVAVAHGTAHSCAVSHEKHHFGVTWVRTPAVLNGFSNAEPPVIPVPAKELLRTVLDVESDQYETAAEEGSSTPTTADMMKTMDVVMKSAEQRFTLLEKAVTAISNTASPKAQAAPTSSTSRRTQGSGASSSRSFTAPSQGQEVGKTLKSMSHLWGMDSSGCESSEDGVEDEDFLSGLGKEPTETNPSSSAKGGQPDINTLISFEILKEYPHLVRDLEGVSQL